MRCSCTMRLQLPIMSSSLLHPRASIADMR